jgi:hypothetical protein
MVHAIVMAPQPNASSHFGGAGCDAGQLRREPGPTRAARSDQNSSPSFCVPVENSQRNSSCPTLVVMRGYGSGDRLSTLPTHVARGRQHCVPSIHISSTSRARVT